MKRAFIRKNFRRATEALIDQANLIIEEYSSQGFSLTVRQLYYQFVARDLIPNTMKSYKSLAATINEARLAGWIDWDMIEDRTRVVKENYHEETPSGAIVNALAHYRLDLWETQPRRVEVWIEKEALTGVIEKTCRKYDVPFFACRGYVSGSAMWEAYNRSLCHPLTIIHLGDHDPSGMDMSRDNLARLTDVMDGNVELHRIALNMDQVDQYTPPPNPAKLTDTRARDYIREFGRNSWELDALEPKVINGLIEAAIEEHIEPEEMKARLEQQHEDREVLQEIIDNLE